MARDELLEDFDFPCSGDWLAYYREQEGGPMAVGSIPPPPHIPRAKPFVYPEPLSGKRPPQPKPIGGVIKRAAE
jgi:hypothetical protein